jgi:selenide,water dikinase
MLACPTGDALPLPLVVDLDGAAIPVFPGALHLLAEGYASTLAPANGEALMALRDRVQVRAPDPQRPSLEGLLIDPQTCGPLLAALPAPQAPAALQAIHAAGFGQAAVIGFVRAPC